MSETTQQEPKSPESKGPEASVGESRAAEGGASEGRSAEGSAGASRGSEGRGGESRGGPGRGGESRGGEGRGGQGRGGEGRGREGHGGGRGAPGPQGGRGDHPRGGDDRRGGGGDRGRFDGPPEIDIEKLISDPLYLDNQAHGVVSRMRDMDSGTRSQLRRLYNAVRRAVRAPENERQQQFVMLRARLAYTIARHSLRSLDSLEKLLLQVTRKNDARGYERFRDLFEAIVAYNE
jgi:CRISPR type III-A-associated protein Csm2